MTGAARLPDAAVLRARPGGELRNRTTRSPDLTGLAVLRIAVLDDAAFQWTAHEPAAVRQGLHAGGRRPR
jgi:hypothetical protein